MKPEPLKGKRFVAVLRNSNWEGYSVENVKSAVEWLLSEIDKEKKDREISAYDVGHYDEGSARFQSGFASGLRHAEYLIKTAFEDVMENEKT